jgi:hypothetical protein
MKPEVLFFLKVASQNKNQWVSLVQRHRWVLGMQLSGTVLA